jgi:prepilin-type N-terminal cleavage/methylation domain-containing protein
MTRQNQYRDVSAGGLTLIEIMMALAVFAVAMTVVVKAFSNHQNTLVHMDQRSEMQVTARNTMHFLETHIQMMGFSPHGRLDSGDAMDVSAGCRAEGGWLVFRRNDPDPKSIHTIQTISINLYKAHDNDGGRHDGLADADVGATGLIIQNVRAADDIVAIRFAYAFDDDRDGCLDLSAGGNIIWAIDTDDDGQLDTAVDTDDDGIVGGDDIEGGAPLSHHIAIDRIAAVKVWLLARTAAPLRGERDRRTFVVGDRRCAVDDYYGHVLLTSSVRCRNMIAR